MKDVELSVVLMLHHIRFDCIHGKLIESVLYMDRQEKQRCLTYAGYYEL